MRSAPGKEYLGEEAFDAEDFGASNDSRAPEPDIQLAPTVSKAANDIATLLTEARLTEMQIRFAIGDHIHQIRASAPVGCNPVGQLAQHLGVDQSGLHRIARVAERIRGAERQTLLSFLGLLVFLLARNEKTKPRRGTATLHPPEVGVTGRGSLADPPLAGIVSGRVLSREGDRGTQANVCAADSVSSTEGGSRATCVDAGRDGRYSIALHAAGAYSITAQAPGFKPGSAGGSQRVRLALGERKAGLDIVLDHGGVKVSGVVTDITGGPVPGAVVRAIRFAPPENTASTETDPEGAFALWVTPGDVRVDAQAEGYAPNGTAHVAPSANVVIRLTPGSRVRGKVVSAADQSPVSGILVRAMPQTANSLFLRSGRSDDSGAFGISGMEPGAYGLVAEGVGWWGESDEPVQVGLAQTVADATVTVRRAATVRGRVETRVDRQPCSVGSVTLGGGGRPTLADPPSLAVDVPSLAPAGVPELWAAIEPDGSVNFPAAPSGSYHAVVQCADHILSGGPSTVEVGEANVDGLFWKVDSGVGLVVHMLDEADRPLPGAVAWLASPSRGTQIPVKADAEGRYEHAAVLYPGAYQLRAAAAQGYEADPVAIRLAEGMGKVEVALRFKGKGWLLVTVQKPDAKPIDDVTVSATRASAQDAPDALTPASGASVARKAAGLDANGDVTNRPRRPARFRGIPLGGGRFRVGPLAPGRYVVHASDGINPPFDSGNPSDGIEVAQGVVDVTIKMERGASIHGIVVDQSKQPLPDTWVTVGCNEKPGNSYDPQAWLPPNAVKRTMTDKSGRFTAEDLRENAYCTVRAEQPFGASGTTRDVRPGDNAVVTLESAKANTNTETVADDNGAGR